MELPELGKHCSNKECKRLEFLPYNCPVCNLPFCDQHIRNHGCVYNEDNIVLEPVQNRPESSLKCLEAGCKDTRTHMLIMCKDCKGHYCVTHRHINCPNVSAPEIRPDPAKAAAEMFKYAKEAVDQHVNLNIEKARKKSKNAEMANKVQLMRLKSKASGLPSIPSQDRAYFLIKIGQEKNEKQEFPLFVSSDWSVGRAIDTIAATCKLKNQNNLPNAPKLRLFRDGDHQILTENLTEKISDLFNRNVISNGETLFMDYV